jgi:CBS domain containing-hemolysin-like protein
MPFHFPDPRAPATARIAAGLAALAMATSAEASFLSGDALDTAANVISWVALILVPLILIVVFWIVHVMPEKIAERNHHPQAKAINTLCLLSLVFGGMLWPIAWLWAYTKPVAYRVAYGTDKGETYFEEYGEKARRGELLADDLRQLREELDDMHARGVLPPRLVQLRQDLRELPAPVQADATAAASGEAR